MRKIIIDTNFLFIPAQFHVDIYAEMMRICHFPYELCVVDKSMQELEKIASRGKTKEAKAARLSLALAQAKKVTILPSEHIFKNTDDTILELAQQLDSLVATQDIALKRKLKAAQVPLVVLRQKRHLILDGLHS